MKYKEMISAIEDAIIESQARKLGRGGATAIYIAVRPVLPSAAKALGLELGELMGYSCSTEVGIEKCVGKVHFPLGDLPGELVRYATASSKEKKNYRSPVPSTTMDEFLRTGTVSYAEIRISPPEKHELGEKAWCEVFIAGCDTLATNNFIKRSIYDGLQALTSYVGDNSKRKLYVSP